MSRRVILLGLLSSILLVVAACGDPDNNALAAYGRLRQAIIEEDHVAAFRLVHPEYRRGYRRMAEKEVRTSRESRDPVAQRHLAAAFGCASFAKLEALPGDELAIAYILFHCGNNLRRDVFEHSRVMDDWSARDKGVDRGVQTAGPDHAIVWAKSEAHGRLQYRFMMRDGRWWWRPHMPVTLR